MTPADPATYLLVTATLGVPGMLATLVPARRATRVDPMVIMRETG